MRSVNLPNMKPNVELPEQQAYTLEIIMSGGESSVSSLALIEGGILNPPNVISKLRKHGAIIKTKRMSAIDAQGRRRSGIAHYTYLGWRPLSEEERNFA
ncbi:helix-turn-helix domain-containing protein [uncultured Pseudoteredinibacter sp.]|uniref:helix-turn-helix domain-containing protein n=1 Tax=uncultured Pseudoteredinibacter sp. TaxID=1641701 RepID=UPI002639AB82|nr:helix-turn-helix domain-containing protein [uncultured Pseudoteredinibacter sp.]